VLSGICPDFSVVPDNDEANMNQSISKNNHVSVTCPAKSDQI